MTDNAGPTVARLARAQRPADAAVAVILRPRVGDDLDVLFIRRPERAHDRWSGDVAFPGGIAKPGEPALRTAAREAQEEVAISFLEPTGVLTDRFTASPRPTRRALGRRLLMRIRPVVFLADRDAEPTPDPREVAEAFWVPLSRLRRLPTVPIVRRIGPRLRVPFAAIDLDGRTLWGLTFLMVRELRRRELP